MEYMSMKRFLVLVIGLAVLLPGCRDKQADGHERRDKSVRIERESKKSTSSGRSSVFLDDDVQDFVFEEEAGTDAFSAGVIKDESAVKLVETPDDRQWGDHRIDQAQHGFKTIYFDFDRFSINQEQTGALEHDLGAVKKATNGDAKVVVEGHSCRSAGSDVYNMLLSEKRAQSVARYLVDHGVAADKLKIVGRGNEMCIVPVGTREQQAPNRRVELYVLDETAQV